jgi:hypothetical protein
LALKQTSSDGYLETAKEYGIIELPVKEKHKPKVSFGDHE